MSTTVPVRPEQSRRAPPVHPRRSRREPVEGHFIALCKHLPLIAAAPGGIKKLRELILELAVRGKLVLQDPNDESASELLDRVRSEKTQLASEGKIKKSGSVAVIGQEEAPFELPERWEWARLGEIMDIVRGITFSASEKSKEPETGRVACLRTANVQDQIQWSDLLYIRRGFVSRDDQYLQPFDIVMSMANSRELVGKVAIVDKELSQEYTFGGFLGVLRSVWMLPAYILAILRAPSTRDVLIGNATQTTNIANISLGKLRPLVVAVPPISEQHRIVAKVDELMALCDRLEAQQTDAEAAHATLVKSLLDTLTQSQTAADFTANWQRLSAHFDTLFATESSIDALKQTLLQLAVMGKLVPQDPSDEPANQLIERVERERARLIRAGKLKPSKALRETGGATQLFQLSVGWRWAAVMQVCDVQGGIQKTPKRRPISNHYPYLRVANVQRGAITVTDLERFEMLPDELMKWRLQSGDILVVEGNGSEDEIGRCAIWDGRIPDCVYQNHLIRVRPTLIESADFIQLFLNSPPGMAEMKQLAVTTSGLFNLSVGKIKSIQIPIPPVAEQERIVAKIDELMALCDRLKARLTDSSTVHEQLADALAEQAVTVSRHRRWINQN